jgi:Oligosaccharide biosynthesis protein Alg14 like
MRIPTIYLEVYDRIDGPTLTGRLCRPVASLFCVQWPEQLDYYRGSELVGSVM